MTTTGLAVSIVIAGAALAAAEPARAGEPPRVWILPFEPLQLDPAVAYLSDALPTLLSVAASQSDEIVVVDREALDEVLDELSLTLSGLSSRSDTRRVGRLLGATIMVTGSYRRQDDLVLVSCRATDLETGLVLATAHVTGALGDRRALVEKLSGAILPLLGAPLPDPSRAGIDTAPLSNLHFMKGLGHYFSARYSQALAEFITAAEDEAVSELARLWLARTYMANRQYGQAYFELIRLVPQGGASGARTEIARLVRQSERQLKPDEAVRIQALARMRSATVEASPATRALYRCAADRPVTLPLTITASDVAALRVRADLVQRGTALAAPVRRDLEVPIRAAAPAGSPTTAHLTLTFPAVARATDFELRFRSRRLREAAWSPAGRVLVHVYPAALVESKPSDVCQ